MSQPASPDPGRQARCRSGAGRIEVWSPLTLVATAFVLFWIQLLGHELAHMLGRILSTGNADLTVRWPLRVRLSMYAAGPALTLVLMAMAAAVARSSSSARTRVVAAILGCGAASRVVYVAPAAILNLAGDERTIARLLHIPYAMLGVGELLITAAAVSVIVRSLPATIRRATLAWSGLGIALGWLSFVIISHTVGIPIG